MGDGTAIQWSDATWNPILGCSRVSPGCERCYAEVTAARNERMGVPGYEPGLVRLSKKGEPRWTGEVRFLPERLDQPLRWKRPRRIFVNSMSDLFHDRVSDEEIAAVFGVMAATPRHTYQILTKRPERAHAWFEWARRNALGVQPMGTAYLCASIATNRFHSAALMHRSWCDGARCVGWPLQNAWLGVSAEDQQRADERIPFLLDTPAAVRWVSYEPALGPIDFTHLDAERAGHPSMIVVDALTGRHRDMGRPCRDVARLDWIVIGGESDPGARARPFDVEWARRTIEQAREAGVPVFVKQLGANARTRNDDTFTIEEDPPDPDFPGWPSHLEAEGRVEWNPDGPEHYQGAPVRLRFRHRKGGDPSEWRSDLRVREWPAA